MTEHYLLFAGDKYYPRGGWLDYKMDFVTAESAEQSVTGFSDEYDWWQIVNSETRTVVKSAVKDLSSGDWEVVE